MSSRRRAEINWVKHSMWLERAGNVCGRAVSSRLGAGTYSTVHLIQRAHTHIMHTHEPARARGNKLQSARRRSQSEAANVPDGKTFKTKNKYLNLLKQFQCERETGEQLEVLRPRLTHRHTHAQTLEAARREMERDRGIMATSSSSIRASQTKQTSSF